MAKGLIRYATIGAVALSLGFAGFKGCSAFSQALSHDAEMRRLGLESKQKNVATLTVVGEKYIPERPHQWAEYYIGTVDEMGNSISIEVLRDDADQTPKESLDALINIGSKITVTKDTIYSQELGTYKKDQNLRRYSDNIKVK